MVFKIAIVGTRENVDVEYIHNRIKKITTRNILTSSNFEIVSGGAKGVDTCAKSYAHKHGITYVELAPNWKKYGKIWENGWSRRKYQYCKIL